jgi:hypothetical protein
MKGIKQLLLVPLLLGFAITQPALAFEYPLSGTAIRSAFLTGNENNDRTVEFFLKYAHSLPAPASGPHVAIISLRTPFEQVVERGATVTDYHAQEAEQEFLGKPLPFLVRVQIDFTPTYPTYPATGPGGAHSLLEPLPDVARDFKIEVVQDKTISPRATRMYLAYSDASYNIFGTSGVVIEQEYDPEQIEPSDVTVKVHTPDGQDVETTFDLGHLQ